MTRIVKARRSPVQGWYSTTLNKWTPAPAVEAIRTGRNVRYVTLLVPIPRPDTGVRISGLAVQGSRVRFTVKVDERRERVVMAGKSVTITTLPNERVGPRPNLSRERSRVAAARIDGLLKPRRTPDEVAI
jgi:hypothetical protein